MTTRGTIYRITIEGRLDPSWSDRLPGMKIEAGASGSPPVTVLSGRLVDPSALHGVLHVLLDLHLPILSMERVAEPKPMNDAEECLSPRASQTRGASKIRRRSPGS